VSRSNSLILNYLFAESRQQRSYEPYGAHFARFPKIKAAKTRTRRRISVAPKARLNAYGMIMRQEGEIICKEYREWESGGMDQKKNDLGGNREDLFWLRGIDNGRGTRAVGRRSEGPSKQVTGWIGWSFINPTQAEPGWGASAQYRPRAAGS
jgi:hypothetical protein